MFNFLKNLFKTSPKISFSTGALESPIDSRNIDIALVQAPVSIPAKYKTDLSMLPVENQMQLGTCVAQATMKLVQYYIYRHTNAVTDLSARAIYRWAKDIDGNPGQGTYPSVMAKVVTTKGIPLAMDAPNDNSLPYSSYLNIDLTAEEKEEALDRLLSGYAFVPADLNAIKQAIYQNGVVAGVTDVDPSWFGGVIGKISQSIGRHNTLFFGYDELGIFSRNSWGSGWYGRLLNYVFGPGEFYFKWEDYKNNIYEMIAYLDIPANILEDAKKKSYIFYNNLKYGDTGIEVSQLQARLNKELGINLIIDGKLFSGTRSALMTYQRKNNLMVDGIFGPGSRAKMNTAAGAKNYIDEWCGLIKQMEGALPARNNPGNLRFADQQYAINNNGFAKFDTYQHGYDALKKLLIRACTGQSANYSPDMTVFEFYAGIYDPKYPMNPKYKKYPGYAPIEDGNNPTNYSNFVARGLGVSVTTKIKDLVD